MIGNNKTTETMAENIPEKPRVSVIIPTYNRAKFLLDAIESVLNQTYPNVEIIVIDDGSTDNTKEVLKPFDGKIRYLSSNHSGVAHARNLGMRAASGKYIAFLDSDDMYLPYKLSLQVDFIEKHPAIGMVCSDISGRYEDGTLDEFFLRNYHSFWNRKNLTYKDIFSESGVFTTDVLVRAIEYYSGDIFKYVLHEPLIPSNTILFDKKILEVVGYQNVSYRFAQEYEFVVRICKHFRIAFLDIPTYILAVHENQATAYRMKENRTNEEIICDIDMWNVQINSIIDWGYNDEEFYRNNKKKIDHTLAHFHYIIGKNWLKYGDLKKANKSFKMSFGFKKFSIKLFCWWLLSFMPRKIIKTILNVLKHGRTFKLNKLSG